MKSILAVGCLILFAACGSGGGDSKVEEGAVTVEPAPVPQANLYCEHSGDLFRVTDGVAEPADEQAVTAVEETTDALGQTTKAITINGAVQIVAECGSSVVFEVADNTSTTTNTGVPSEVN